MSAAIAPGAKVLIVRGLAAGIRATVEKRWPKNLGGVPQWVVLSDDLVCKRVVRADYLEVQP